MFEKRVKFAWKPILHNKGSPEMLCSLFSQSIKIVHKSTFCSKATIFYIICAIVNILLPFIIIERSDGLWIKHDSFRKQPSVHFKYELIIALETNNSFRHLFWSSFKALNSYIKPKLIRHPTIKNYEIDENSDGKNDFLKMFISVPLEKEENVFGVKALLLFDYSINNIGFKMDSIVFINQKTCFAASKLVVGGRLKFHQNKLLSLKHNGYSYFDIYGGDEFSFEELIETNLKQNFSTSLGDETYYLWQSALDADDDTFDIEITIFYSEDTYLYKTGFWYLLKWAWIQYLAIFAIVFLVIEKIKNIVFCKQLISTFVYYEKYPSPLIK